MTTGIAVCLGTAPASKFNAGSTLYRLYPSLGSFEHLDSHVVVAFSPRAVDHGQPETSVFRTNAQGYPEQALDRGAEVLTPSKRIVGRHDQEAALANVSGGYLVVESARQAELERISRGLAKEFACNIIGMQEADAEDYAFNNWGMFAATYLKEVEKASAQAASSNKVDWASLVSGEVEDFEHFF